MQAFLPGTNTKHVLRPVSSPLLPDYPTYYMALVAFT